MSNLDLSGNNAEHSILSASSASHWRTCIASAVFADSIPNFSGDAAREGTALHAIVEDMINTGKSPEDYTTMPMEDKYGVHLDVEINEEQKECLTSIIDHIREYAEGGGLLYPESRVYYGDALGVPNKYAYGTGDVTLIDVENKTLHIMDSKFGRNKVNAYKNPQLCLYAAGVLTELEMLVEIESVVLHVLQPRCGKFSLWHTTPEGVEEVIETLRPAAKRIVGIHEGVLEVKLTDYGTDPNDCKYCYFKGVRNPYQVQLAKDFLKIVKEIGMEKFMEEDMDYALELVTKLEPFVSAVKEQAYKQALSGHKLKKFKLVEGKPGNRKWVDDPELEFKIKNIYPFEQLTVPQPDKLKSIADLEKEIKRVLKGKNNAPEREALINQLNELTTRGKASIELAPISDDRPEYQAKAEVADDEFESVDDDDLL